MLYGCVTTPPPLFPRTILSYRDVLSRMKGNKTNTAFTIITAHRSMKLSSLFSCILLFLTCHFLHTTNYDISNSLSLSPSLFILFPCFDVRIPSIISFCELFYYISISLPVSCVLHCELNLQFALCRTVFMYTSSFRTVISRTFVTYSPLLLVFLCGDGVYYWAHFCDSSLY